jgi:transcription elongation factor Elf1
MEQFLICKNPVCRFLLDLREGGKVLSRSEIALGECPECGHQWSSTCPFCLEPLDVSWRGKLPHCSKCLHKLQAQAA